MRTLQGSTKPIARAWLLVCGLWAALCGPGCAGGAASPAASTAGTPRLELEWRTQVTQLEAWGYRPREYASPVFVEDQDDLIVANADGYVTRMRAGSGELVWRQELRGARDEDPAPVHADPAATGDLIYAATLAGSIQALDYDDGKLRWEYRAEDAVEGELVLGQGRLFFTDARDVLYALDAATGKMLWRYQRRAPDFFTIKGSGTPVLDGDVVYCGFADGALVAIQMDTGEEVWSVDLSNEETEFIDVDAPAVVDGRLIYAASYAGGLYGLSRLDGTIQWRVDVDSVVRFVEHQELLYVITAQGLIAALEADTRRTIWAARLEQGAPVELAVQGDYLFVTTSDGPLMIFDRRSGELLTSWNPSQGFNTPPIFHKNRGFLLSNVGYLYGFLLGIEGVEPPGEPGSLGMSP